MEDIEISLDNPTAQTFEKVATALTDIASALEGIVTAINHANR